MRRIGNRLLFLFFLLIPGLVFGAWDASAPLAEQQFSQHQFKDSLATWKNLLEQSPKNLSYAMKVAEMEFLLQGRTQAIEGLRAFLKKNEKVLSVNQVQEIQKKIIELSETFISEEGQVNYLQALSKVNLKEFSSSLPALKHSIQIEPGNLKILILKAEVEKELGFSTDSYQTLKEAFRIDPFSQKTRERLVEAHVFHGKFLEAKALLEDRENISAREKLALAVSDFELGDKENSQVLINDLLRSKKPEFSQHPVTLWMALRSDLETSPLSQETRKELRKLLQASSLKDSYLIDGWDPYRLGTQLESLRKL
jgi:predicted Zn-dependent protease